MIVTTKYCDCDDGGKNKHTMPLETPQLIIGGMSLDICDECSEGITVAKCRLMVTAKKETMAVKGSTRHV
jgi:hypothetical protein